MEEEMEYRKLDGLINKGFKNYDPPHIPASFADRLTQKFELRTVKRCLWLEWGLKMMVIIGIAACLALVLYLTENDLLTYLRVEYVLPLLALPIILFVFLFDQVILKWLFFLRNQKIKPQPLSKV